LTPSLRRKADTLQGERVHRRAVLRQEKNGTCLPQRSAHAEILEPFGHPFHEAPDNTSLSIEPKVEGGGRSQHSTEVFRGHADAGRFHRLHFASRVYRN
jgi:hypothetical protein